MEAPNYYTDGHVVGDDNTGDRMNPETSEHHHKN